MKIIQTTLAALCCTVIFGCANQSSERNELVQRYDSLASQPESREYAPIALSDAEDAINNLKTSIKHEEDVDHYEHIAERRLDIVELKVNAAKSQKVIDKAEVNRKDILLSAREQEVRDAKLQAQSYRQRALSAESKAQSMQAKAEKLAEENEGLSTRITDKGLILSMNSILFEVNSEKLLDGSQRTLQRISEFLVENADNNITISGHTDSTGTEEYNRELSKKRAESVKTALTSRGVKLDRIETEGLGEAYPIANNETKVGRQQNRRVEITIQNDGDVASN